MHVYIILLTVLGTLVLIYILLWQGIELWPLIHSASATVGTSLLLGSPGAEEDSQFKEVSSQQDNFLL